MRLCECACKCLVETDAKNICKMKT
jgi:hypothetical protein